MDLNWLAQTKRTTPVRFYFDEWVNGLATWFGSTKRQALGLLTDQEIHIWCVERLSNSFAPSK